MSKPRLNQGLLPLQRLNRALLLTALRPGISRIANDSWAYGSDYSAMMWPRSLGGLTKRREVRHGGLRSTNIAYSLLNYPNASSLPDDSNSPLKAAVNFWSRHAPSLKSMCFA